MKSARKPEYFLEENGKFTIKNYDLAKPFASFFPGIAGLFGVPMWVFYVNRGQGIVSMGTRDKRNAIMEFFPANRAWQMVTSRGFRTFLKIEDKDYYEPFQNKADTVKYELSRQMTIGSSDFSLKETNKTLGLDFDVSYFNVPEEPIACLVRKITITNTSSTAKNIELVDGLGQIVPHGLSDRFLKELGRTMEAWMQVKFISRYKIPLYRMSVDPTDRPQVIYVKGGNFYYSYLLENNKIRDCEIIVDPQSVFGPITDFDHPHAFADDGFELSNKKQMDGGKTPSGLSHAKVSLGAGKSISLYSFIGHVQNENYLNGFAEKLRDVSYLAGKEEQSAQIISRLQNNIFTQSSQKAYDLYAGQTYLDNVLRGGYPFTLKTEEKTHTFHVYSRKHGDLERDYNDFLTEATYFSQGNGNYRYVNQNRRDDVWFNPEVADSNINTFFNLTQLDGFNPLVVFGDRFSIKSGVKSAVLYPLFAKEDDAENVFRFLKQKFAPGALFMYLEENDIKLKVSQDKFFSAVMSHCERRENAEHGDGFWVDHWIYNLDLLESYLAIFPENLKKMIFERKKFVFFNNFVKVEPREEKYILFDGRARQYHSVSLEEIEHDSALAKKIKSDNWAVRTEYGQGQMYKTTLLVKLITLIVNKASSLDPFGCGIEMEANKPGWYDALNGLPGLFGSSVCETLELKRLLTFLTGAVKKLKIDKDLKVNIPAEICEFIQGLDKELKAYLSGKNKNRDFIYWDQTYALKEKYRKKIHNGISGKEETLSLEKILDFFQRILTRLDESLKMSRDEKSGLYHTYFINEVVDFEKIKTKDGYKLSKDGLFCIRAKKFKQTPLPLFLEGQVHAFRVDVGREKARELYQAAKKSALYDKELKMFKVNASLVNMSLEIGRARVFTPGWLENESIWLHMEYKFLLELLRTGLYDEFFAEMKNVMIPFQPAERYGRSILENSSFLVSSAYPDKSLHGNGFVARLSGSTAEFVNMWLWMSAGREPFRLDAEGKVVLRFEPILPGWMFTEKKQKAEFYGKEKVTFELPENSYAFNFLGGTLVCYHNPSRKNTYGEQAAVPVKIKIEDRQEKVSEVSGPEVGEELAKRIRNGEIKRIDIELE